MSSIRCVDLLRHARENSYAVGYFEAWNLESLLAIVRAAENARSPVMVGFCGEYLANPQRKFKEDINLYGALARHVAQSVSVPVATLLNESTDMDVAYQGVKADFDMVMFVDEGMPIDRLTGCYAKARRVCPCLRGGGRRRSWFAGNGRSTHGTTERGP